MLTDLQLDNRRRLGQSCTCLIGYYTLISSTTTANLTWYSYEYHIQVIVLVQDVEVSILAMNVIIDIGRSRSS